MPRSNGTYTLPSEYLAVSGTPIRTVQHNRPLEDIGQALTDSLPRDGSAPMTSNLDMGGKKISNVAAGTAQNDAVTIGQFQSALPLGTVVDYAGVTPPPGWLFCAGQFVSRTTYAGLFAVIGTTFGPGDNLTTFALPDLRGFVVAGRDNMNGGPAGRITAASGGLDGTVMGRSGGSQGTILGIQNMPAHSHTATVSAVGDHTHNFRSGLVSITQGGNSQVSTYNSTDTAPTTAAGAHTHSVGIGSTGGSEGFSLLQPTMILNKIIKVQ